MGQYDRKPQSQPKHGKPLSSSRSKAAPPLPKTRPAERGPGYTPKAPPKKSQPPATPPPTRQPNDVLPLDLQQLVLDIFCAAFPACRDFEALKPLLGRVNEALGGRDWGLAFGGVEEREGYVVRWGAGRAVVFANVVAGVCGEFGDCAFVRGLLGGEGGEGGTSARVVCLGGGAAEVGALAAVLRSRRADAAGKPDAAASLLEAEVGRESTPASASVSTPVLDVRLVDVADWSGVVDKLAVGLETAPQLSKYASAAARARNAAFLAPGMLRSTCVQADLLDLTLEQLQGTLGSDVTLVTLMFTLNDLYAASIRRATAFLLKLTAVVPKGCLLLVVDAHGASARADGAGEGETEAYPMSWLLDKALLPAQVAVDGEEELVPKREWEKLVGDTNRMFKFPEKGLSYPAGLENLKLQLHLFKRV